MRNTKISLLLLLLTFLTAGCQSNQPLRSAGVDNGSFMNLWNTYSHCQKSEDVHELIDDAVVLGEATVQVASSKTLGFPLPGKLERLVSTPSTRLAVDLKAMSAACSLRAGRAAADVQRFENAREILEPILNYHPKSDYRFYTLQAEAILSEIVKTNVQVSFNIP